MMIIVLYDIIKALKRSGYMAKFIIMVMDSVGVGEMPDAAKYGDTGSNTVGNIIKQSDY